MHRQSSLLYCLCKECNEIDFIVMFITSKSILFYKVKILNKILLLSIFFKSLHYKTHSKFQELCIPCSSKMPNLDLLISKKSWAIKNDLFWCALAINTTVFAVLYKSLYLHFHSEGFLATR